MRGDFLGGHQMYLLYDMNELDRLPTEALDCKLRLRLVEAYLVSQYGVGGIDHTLFLI